MREQLELYPSVTVRDVFVDGIVGARGAFQVQFRDETVGARRLLLCTGMVDEMLPIEGFSELASNGMVAAAMIHVELTMDIAGQGAL